MRNMTNALEDEATIEQVSTANLATISFIDMLNIYRPFVLVDIPEDASTIDMKKRLDYLLARCANLYAYFSFMGAFASYERARFKKIDDTKAEDMLKKKEALFELASAMKLKYEACSRKITLAVAEEGDSKVVDRVNYESRTSAPRPSWDQSTTAAPKSATPPETAARRGGGGWGNV